LPVVFAFGLEARLEAPESGFPPRLWQMPSPTRALVGWPMLWGSALVGGMWLVLAVGVLRPSGYPVALWWPGLLLAVVLTWLQTLMWLPFPLPWLRPIVLVPVVSAVSIGPALLIPFDVPEPWVCGLLALLLLVAYGLALAGVTRARHGGVRRWEWPTRIRAARSHADFASPARAHRWFEWRRCGYSFPLMVTFIALTCLPSLTTIARFVDDSAQAGIFFFPQALLRELGSLWLTSAWLLVGLLFMAGTAGPELGKLPGRERKEQMAAFLATRPVSTGLLVRAKCAAAAQTILVGWGLLTVGFLLWFATSGKASEMLEQFTALRQRHAAGPLWTSVGLVLGGAVVLSWLNVIGGLWLGQVSRGWQTAIVVVLVFAWIGSSNAGVWVMKTPENWQRFVELLPWLTAATVGLKLLAACWSLRALRQRQLLSRRFLAAGVGGWLLVVVALFGVLAWLLPRTSVSLSALILGLAFLIPLTRLALAPLTLDWNRHR
jgi:hypothetical protein